MNGVFLFILCALVVCALTLFLILACGVDAIKPRPTPPKLESKRGDVMCRRRQSRTRLGEFLKCSHPEWN